MHLSSLFDAGAIEIVDATDPGNVRLRIRQDDTNDPSNDFRQWFYFRASGVRGTACRFVLENASDCTYAEGWEGYLAAASYDREHWFRVPTTYEDGKLIISHTPARNSVYYAYFEPYSWERHLRLLGRAEASPLAKVETLGVTLDGRDLDLIRIGRNGHNLRKVWVIARQHPGETMAEWFCEGLVDRLLDGADPFARRLLEVAEFYIVPNMNPDGSVRGNLRSNAAGANLNREWLEPSAERSPEVLLVRERMQQIGVDLFLDVHGDEGLPYVFVDGCEMLPGFTEVQAAAQQAFIDHYKLASLDFQDVHGYPRDKDTKVNLTLASKWVGHTFGCISLTLEMPFKDNANLPDPTVGWNGARSRRLGEAVLQPIAALLA